MAVTLSGLRRVASADPSVYMDLPRTALLQTGESGGHLGPIFKTSLANVDLLTVTSEPPGVVQENK